MRIDTKNIKTTRQAAISFSEIKQSIIYVLPMYIRGTSHFNRIEHD
jgi:hypothetical protein